MDIRQLYNQVPQTARGSSSWSWGQLGTRCRTESQRLTEGFGPSVIHGWAAIMRKKCCYGQKNLGSICSSLSPSPTRLSHTTNINPFENKEWEIYFYKEVCSFVHWSSYIIVDYVSACICIRAVVLWIYNRFCQILPYLTDIILRENNIEIENKRMKKLWKSKKLISHDSSILMRDF